MAVLRPFSCIRPEPELAARIASGPHSAMSREEIRRKVVDNPLSYSRVVHPRALFGNSPVSVEEAYRAASGTLERWMREGIMRRDAEDSFYLYRLERGDHVQTGLVGCTPVDDVLSQRILAHEKVRVGKVRDLALHMEICGAQIGGPMLMTYRNRPEISEWMGTAAEREPAYRFVSENGILNTIWKISDPGEMAWVEDAMGRVPALYISDGHHRVMAAVEICRRMREKNPDYTGREPWNRFACVCFPDDQLQILSYSRRVDGLGGLTEEEFLTKLDSVFRVGDFPEGETPVPRRRGEFAMYLSGKWYRLILREEFRPSQVAESLDVSVLYSRVLRQLLGIDNAKNHSRLEFVGGLEQQKALEERCRKPGSVGFTPYPISMGELLAVADAGAIMPPKSTWFEPKLCNGLFIHAFYDIGSRGSCAQ